MSLRTDGIARAYGACVALARSHYENFPVASWLLPPDMRPHVAAVYAFARIADDIADEGSAPPAARQHRLRVWQQHLHDAVVDGEGQRPADGRDELVILALSQSVRALDLPLSLFDDLVSAFGQDTMTTRYRSWADVMDYCRRSANPVGRLMLHIAGHRDAALFESSDALCTALQLTNFWQDFGRDWDAGRLYVPADVAEACGASERDLAAHRMTPAWARAIDACCAFTRHQFDAGRGVCQAVHGRLRYELRLTWLGGRRILGRVEQHPADLLGWRPALGAADLPGLLWGAARWSAAR